MTIRSGADNEHIPVIFDARGNGDGKISCTITGDHESRITDYTSIILGGGRYGDGCQTFNTFRM